MMKKMLMGCTETLPCFHESQVGHHGSVMSCQSLSCDADPLPSFHRSVHFSDPERKSMECSIDYHGGDDASEAGGSWGPAWSRAMSRSAPAATCPTPMFSNTNPLENANAPSTARFPRLEECAHFHYGRVDLGGLRVCPIENDLQNTHQQQDEDDAGWVTIRVRPHLESRNPSDSADEARDQNMHGDQDVDRTEWIVTRSAENFRMLDTMLHRCIYDRKVSGLPDLSIGINLASLEDRSSYNSLIADYLHHFSIIADDTINCGPILNWFQMDNKGHKLLVATEDSSSINTPAVAAAYSVKRYVSQARDEISFEVGDMISVIDMPGASESTWWRGKRGFRVGFFPQECVAVIGDKVPRNMKQPPPIVGSVAVAPIKPVLRKHGKLISLFRSFILSRPSRRALRQQGILKERVFGCDLGEHLLNSGQEVPQVLSWCASIIEEHGCVDGIYRLSGAASATQRLRLAFDEERPPPNPPAPLDVHGVASLLKMYFRELPNPLCTYQLYSYFVSAVKSAESSDGTELRRLDEAEKLVRMRDTVMKLPPPHYRTLAFLMRHLHGMSLLSSNTGMTARNMGIVWAPNLLRSPHHEFSLSGVAIQVVVTEFLICYADLIFSDDQRPPERSTLQDTNGSLDSVDSQISALVKRPKSLPLATPTKLLSLEEARHKQQLRPSSAKEPHYIEVGGGPNSLPRYHTIIQLPPGSTKRGLKRSPSGWRGLFFRASKHRTLPSSSPTHPRISEPMLQNVDHPLITDQAIKIERGETTTEKMTVDEETRSTRSCESLGSEGDSLPPLLVLPEPQIGSNHHNRSASCDSYFEASLAELAGMRLRLSSQEREMDIFSEDDTARQGWNKNGSSSEDTTADSSPVKAVQPTISTSQNSINKRKSVKLEELSDLVFIDCNTPEHTALAAARAKNAADANVYSNSENKSPEFDEEDRFSSTLKCDSPQHSTTIKVKMRDRSSPRRNDKPSISRHSHCGPPFSPQKAETAQHRHSTLIQVGWVDANELRPHGPNLCGYSQLQSDSETSLQIGESKDSLAKRLIESKESLDSHSTEENRNVVENSGMLTWVIDSQNNERLRQKQHVGVHDNEGNKPSEIVNEFDAKENLDLSTKPSQDSDESHSFVHVDTKNRNSSTCSIKLSNSSENLENRDEKCSNLINFDNVNCNYEDIANAIPPDAVCVQKSDMTTSSESENYHYDDIDECDRLLSKHKMDTSTYGDLENTNRCSVTVTPSDENFSSNVPDSLDESLSASNISYHNLNRLSMLSGESGKANLSKESTPTYSPHEQERTEEIYECFNFTKPSYSHLASSSGGSTPISPQSKSPLKSTISITYKSPVKENTANSASPKKTKSPLMSFQENLEYGIYEDVGEIENLATVPNPFEASLPVNVLSTSNNVIDVDNVTETDCDDAKDVKPQFILNDNNNIKSAEPQEDRDIYNRVKFFRQSVNEVNSLIMESDGEPKDSSSYEDSLDANLDGNLEKCDVPNFKTVPKDEELVVERNYENVDYSEQSIKVAESHPYENVDINLTDISNKAEWHKSNPVSSSPMISPLTELCYDRHVLKSFPSDVKNSAYENFVIETKEEMSRVKENVNDVPKLSLGESDKENSDENENLSLSIEESFAGKRSSVKQLAHKFESPTETKGPFYFDRSFRTNLSTSERIKEGCIQTFDRSKAVSFCEGRGKVSLIGKTVPCVRARNHRLAKHSGNARSLDENAFIKEFGSQVLHKDHISEMEISIHESAMNRRKSLEALKSLNQPKRLPDLNLNTECNKVCNTKPNLSLSLDMFTDGNIKENIPSNFSNRYVSITPTSENKICLVQARLSPKKSNKCKQFGSVKWDTHEGPRDINEDSENYDKKEQLSRERIEKYKEERRLFLREKYSSQSFRGIGDFQAANKYKGGKNDDLMYEEVQLRNPGKLERRNTADATQRSKFSIAISEFRANDEILQPNVLRNEFSSLNPTVLNENIAAKINSAKQSEGPKVMSMQRKFSLDAGNPRHSGDTAADAITESPKNECERPKTLGAFELSPDEKIKRDTVAKSEICSSSSVRKEKRSPSFNIKDMTAIFEQKSINKQLNQNQ